MASEAEADRKTTVSLWRHGDFRRLWTGETISLFGTQITVLALPLTAILTLRASAFEMGALAAAASAPYLLFSLLAGVWVDRLRRRPILIAADIGQAVLLASIPLAVWLGQLRIAQLYVVAFLAGTLSVAFDVAYQSYLPSLLERAALVEGNSRLASSASLAQIAGPGLAGGLVQLITAPLAVLADAGSFLVSALFLGSIRTSEPAPQPRPADAGIWHEIREGLALVVANPVLRSLSAASATFNLFDGVLFAVYLLYMTRTVHVAPAAVGLVFALGGFGGLAGSLLTAPITRGLGLGRTILIGAVLAVVAEFGIALATGPAIVAISILVVAEGAVELGAMLFSINSTSLRQAITPDHLQGRVSATVSFLRRGGVPIGSLLGGFLGQTIGLRPTVLAAGTGTLLAVLWIVFSPVRRLRS